MQTLSTQMRCSVMRNFIRIYTVSRNCLNHLLILSSSYDFCRLLNWFQDSGCPWQLRVSGFPCTCPFTNGSYHLQPYPFYIYPLNSAWSWLAYVCITGAGPGFLERGVYIFFDFSLTVKAATFIFISGRGSAISSAKQGESGFIYNLVKSPGIFVRGGGVQVRLTKKSSDNFFYYYYYLFFSQLILQKSNGQFQRNLSFFKVPEGSNIFQGGPTFSKGGPIAYSL